MDQNNTTALKKHYSPIDAFLAAGGLPGRSALTDASTAISDTFTPPPEALLTPSSSGGGVGVEAEPDTYLIHEHIVGSANATNGFDGVLGEKLDRHAKQHRRALEMAKFCQNIAPHRAEKLRTCGAWLQFRDYYTEGEVRLTSAQFCHQDRLCPFCAYRRAGRHLRAAIEKVRAVVAENKELRPYLLTLTVKNGDDLGERVQHLQQGVKTLLAWRREYNKSRSRGYQPGFIPQLAHAAGGIGAVEVKRGDGSGLWHPHYHAVLLCTGEIHRDDLSAEWLAATHDSLIVDVRPFHCADLLAEVDKGEAFETMAGDFCEVFKYALKFNDLPLEDNWQAFSTLYGKRLIECFGVLKGVEVPDELADQPLGDDLPFIEVLAKFLHREGRYKVAAQFHVDAVGDS